MIYHGRYQNIHPAMVVLLAESEDAINWTPVRAAGLSDYPLAYNALPVRIRVDEQISQVMDDREFEPNPAEALKMLVGNGSILVSDAAGLSWSFMDNDQTEWTPRQIDPGFFAYRRPEVGDVVFSARVQEVRGAGRHAGRHRGPDWRNVNALNDFSLPLDNVYQQWQQMYGTPVFKYEGLYVGWLWRYWIDRGTVYSNLAYSFDGWDFEAFNNGLKEKQNLTAFMRDVDMPGTDIMCNVTHYPNETQGWTACRAACGGEYTCFAWTYTPIGTNGTAKCCIKDTFQAREPKRGIISGIRLGEGQGSIHYLPQSFSNVRGRSDSNQVYPCTLVTDALPDKLLIHASASSTIHGLLYTGYSSINTYAIRRDGFVYVSVAPDMPSDTVGLLRTQLLRYSGGDLFVNVVAPHDGLSSVSLQLLDASLVPIPGFTFADAVPFVGDLIYWRPRWTSGQTPCRLAGRDIAIEVRIAGAAKLYAIRGRLVLASRADAESATGYLDDCSTVVTTSTGTTGTTAPATTAAAPQVLQTTKYTSMLYQLSSTNGWTVGYYNSSAVGSPVPLNVATSDPTQSLRSTRPPSVRVNLAAGATAATLVVSGFSNAVPATATINGVKVTLLRRAAAAGMQDVQLALVVGGVIRDESKMCTSSTPCAWPVGTARTVTFGGPGLMWGLTSSVLTPAAVNANRNQGWTADNGFGVAIKTNNARIYSNEAIIDMCEVVVYYTTGPVTTSTGTTSTGTTSTGTTHSLSSGTTGTSSTGTTSTGTTSTGSTAPGTTGTTGTTSTGTTSTGTTSTGTTGTTSTGTSSTGTTSTGTTSTGTTAAVVVEPNGQAKSYPKYFYRSTGSVAWNSPVLMGPSGGSPVTTTVFSNSAPVDDTLRSKNARFAAVTLAPDQQSDLLYVQRFSGQNVPPTASIVGVGFILVRGASGSGIRDVSARLVINNAAQAGSERYSNDNPGPVWVTSVPVQPPHAQIGGPTEMWGQAAGSLTISNTDVPTFGLVLRVANFGSETLTAYIDECDLVLYYYDAGGVAAVLDDEEAVSGMDLPSIAGASDSATVPVVFIVAAAVFVAAVAVVVVVLKRKASVAKTAPALVSRPAAVTTDGHNDDDIDLAALPAASDACRPPEPSRANLE